MITPKEMKIYFDMSLTEISECLGYSHAYMSNILSGKLSLPEKRLVAIRKALDTLVEFVDAEEEKVLESRKKKRRELVDYIIEKGSKNVTSSKDKRDIYDLWKSGVKQTEIAEKLGVSKQRVSYICKEVKDALKEDGE